jgi:hypothetical protein
MSNKSKKQPSTKLELIIARLRRPDGATIHELQKLTGWQAHSVRGAISGTLKKKGHSVTSTKVDGKLRYQLADIDNA